MLKSRIGEALELLGEEVQQPGAWRPSGVRVADKTVADASAFLGRLLVPTSPSRKRTGGSRETPLVMQACSDRHVKPIQRSGGLRGLRLGLHYQASK